MTVPSRSLLLKIYIGEEHFSHGIPIYEEILWETKKANLGGATIIKGAMGLGHIGTIQSKENARDHDLPVLIEAIDSPEKINSFIPIAVKLLGNHGLIMTAEVKVVHQGKLYAVPKSPEIKSYD